MATGRLGVNDIPATTDTTVYTCPASTFAVVTVSLCNRNSTTARDIRIAVTTSGTPSDAEYIEYDASLLAKGVLERTGLVLAAGHRCLSSGIRHRNINSLRKLTWEEEYLVES
jgi:hypothetical protein